MHLTAEKKHWSITLEYTCEEEVSFYWDWNGNRWEFTCVSTDIEMSHDKCPVWAWPEDHRGPFAYYELDSLISKSTGVQLTPTDILCWFRKMLLVDPDVINQLYTIDDMVEAMVATNWIEDPTDGE